VPESRGLLGGRGSHRPKALALCSCRSSLSFPGDPDGNRIVSSLTDDRGSKKPPLSDQSPRGFLCGDSDHPTLLSPITGKCRPSPSPADHPHRTFLFRQSPARSRGAPDRSYRSGIITASWGYLSELRRSNGTRPASATGHGVSILSRHIVAYSAAGVVRRLARDVQDHNPDGDGDDASS
jgi:DNA-binding transcriptional LysR family regulator